MMQMREPLGFSSERRSTSPPAARLCHMSLSGEKLSEELIHIMSSAQEQRELFTDHEVQHGRKNHDAPKSVLFHEWTPVFVTQEENFNSTEKSTRAPH